MNLNVFGTLIKRYIQMFHESSAMLWQCYSEYTVCSVNTDTLSYREFAVRFQTSFVNSRILYNYDVFL